MCRNTRLWRENAHFLDEGHKFKFRYFSFMLVNDKLTLCLQGTVVVRDQHTYNNHFASGSDYEPDINIKRPVHRRVSRYRVVDLFGVGCVAALKVAGASFGQWEISIIWGLGWLWLST